MHTVPVHRRRVGVVVVTWHNETTIDECLTSVLAQRGVELDVVVVDNASDDETAAVAARPGVRVMVNEENTGFARAVNQGAAQVQGAFLLILNPDACLLSNDFLERAIDVMLREPDIATLGPRTEFADGSVQVSVFPTPSVWRELVEATGLYRLSPRRTRGRVLLGAHFSYDEPVDAGWLLGACLLVRLDHWRENGGLTEDFHMYAEDLEWGYRVVQQGLRNRYVPELRVMHAGNHSGQIRFGEGRSLVALRSYYGFLSSRWGVGRARSSAFVNLLGALVRMLIYGWRARSVTGASPMVGEYRAVSRFLLAILHHPPTVPARREPTEAADQ